MPLDTDEAPAADAGAPLTDMPAAATIGQMLRARRKDIGKTMKQVAREAGLTEGFISQIERGISTPSLISLYNVANALGTSVDTFLSQPPQHSHSMVSHAGERPGYNVETKERVYELIERGFPGAASGRPSASSRRSVRDRFPAARPGSPRPGSPGASRSPW